MESYIDAVIQFHGTELELRRQRMRQMQGVINITVY